MQVKAYGGDGEVLEELLSLVQKNKTTVERVVNGGVRPEKSDEVIELAHLIELRLVEKEGKSEYYLNDGVLSIATQYHDSQTNPYQSLEQLVLGVKQRIEEQRQTWERNTMCNVTLTPLFYTVTTRETFGLKEMIPLFALMGLTMVENPEAWRSFSFKEFKTALMDALRRGKNTVHRGFSEEERKSFERLFYNPSP